MTTIFTRRTKPSSPSFSRRPWFDFLIQESLFKLLLEDWTWAILLAESRDLSNWSKRPSI